MGLFIFPTPRPVGANPRLAFLKTRTYLYLAKPSVLPLPAESKPTNQPTTRTPILRRPADYRSSIRAKKLLPIDTLPPLENPKKAKRDKEKQLVHTHVLVGPETNSREAFEQITAAQQLYLHGRLIGRLVVPHAFGYPLEVLVIVALIITIAVRALAQDDRGKELLMMLEALSRARPAGLTQLPRAQSDPVAVLQRQSQHLAAVHTTCQLLLGVGVVHRGDHAAQDDGTAAVVQMVARSFCKF